MIKKELVLKKEVDWSLLHDGITLKLENNAVFGQEQGRLIQRGESKNIQLYLDDKVFDARVYNVNFDQQHNRRNDTMQIRYSGEFPVRMQEIFEYSFRYLENHRSNREENDHTRPRVPEDSREYLLFYETDEENKFWLEVETHRENPAEEVIDAVSACNETSAGEEGYCLAERSTLKKITPGEVKDTIEQIKRYIKARGFSYSDGLVENLYLSLKSKPFVILAGISGTGKTRLVKLFAEAIGAEYQLVPVRPDWSDSSDLFGHLDLGGEYFVEGAVIRSIREAMDHPEVSYILCLDEMNLARVEYYFSDFLSVMETRERKDGKIVSQPLVRENLYGRTEARELFGSIYFPENLYLVGTVNMDETTFPFSRKVLDRANTMEFSDIHLIPEEIVEEELPEVEALHNSFLKTEYLQLPECGDFEYVRNICVELEEINQILKRAEAHVGYRIRNEILFYMVNNKACSLLEEKDAFDNEIMQKILPRIQGNSTAVRDVLMELFQNFAGDYTGLSGSNTYEQMMNYLAVNPCRYPKSAKKAAFMMRRFEEDGFTSYWL